MMTPEEKAVQTQVLLSRAIDYWYEVDHNYGMNARDFYLEDSVFVNIRGREAIHQFYIWRKDRGERTSLHLISNFRAEFEGPKLARTYNVMSLYAADGQPVLPSEPAIQIAENFDECVLGDDGQWRYKSRKFTNIFKSPTPNTVPPKEWFDKWSPSN